MPALNALYRKYRDRVEFLTVYIQEAHPSDGWQVVSNVKQNVIVASPRSQAERGAVAHTCVRRLGLELPAVMDTLDDATDTAYTAWPDRYFLVDRDGRLAHISKPGPFGFDTLETERAVDALLARDPVPAPQMLVKAP